MATFVRRLLQGFMELTVILKLSWTGITKRLAKKTNCKELMGMKSIKGIVMLFKGKITLQKNCFALKCELSCVITLSGASKDSYCAKNLVTSADVELQIKKHCIIFTGKTNKSCWMTSARRWRPHRQLEGRTTTATNDLPMCM